MTDWSMTDADFEQQKVRIKTFENRWVFLLGLGWPWEVSVEYWRERLPEKENSPRKHGQLGDQAADCAADWKYLHANVRFCLPACADLDDFALETVVVHEFCHILINETRAMGSDDSDWLDHEERVVSTLSQVLLRVRNFPDAEIPGAVTIPKPARKR